MTTIGTASTIVPIQVMCIHMQWRHYYMRRLKQLLMNIFNSFGGMGLDHRPTFHLLLAVTHFSINSRGIQLVSSHNGRGDRDLQSWVFRSLIRYILHVIG